MLLLSCECCVYSPRVVLRVGSVWTVALSYIERKGDLEGVHKAALGLDFGVRDEGMGRLCEKIIQQIEAWRRGDLCKGMRIMRL